MLDFDFVSDFEFWNSGDWYRRRDLLKVRELNRFSFTQTTPSF
jgi:hypothetical protein